MWGFANKTVTFLLGAFNIFSPNPENSIIVQTQYGQLEGVAAVSRGGIPYYEFLGIPYAQPPTGPLRFKPPLPWNETWEGVRDATSEKQRCIQYHLIGRHYGGLEDCLFLYVYTSKFQRPEQPSIPKEELKPVIIYIHGGLFMQGSGSFYKPAYFMDEDIVFVSMAYRVGALGFLSLDNDDISGNFGLKDQVAALEWVRDNIQNFGGDPDKVTIMGESAGGVSVHLHMLSPMSKGLFHRAISQSGTALNSWGVRDNPAEQAKYFAERLGCPISSDEEIASCLREIDVKKIGRGHSEAATILHHRYALFGPTIESRSSQLTPKFLGDQPGQIIKSGNFNKVPLIIGANSEEGLLYAAPMLRNDSARNQINSNWNYWMPITFRFVDEPEKELKAEKIRSYYFGNSSREITEDSADMRKLIVFVTDRSFFEGMHHTLSLHKGQHPVYPYLYSHKGEFSFGRILLGMTFNVPIVVDFLMSQGKRWVKTKVFKKEEEYFGTAHGDELPLLFELPFQSIRKTTHPDYALSETLIKTWATFAKEGTPPLVNGTIWQELNDDNEISDSTGNSTLPNAMRLLKLDGKREIEMVDEPFHERAEFWKSLDIFPEREYY